MHVLVWPSELFGVGRDGGCGCVVRERAINRRSGEVGVDGM